MLEVNAGRIGEADMEDILQSIQYNTMNYPSILRLLT